MSGFAARDSTSLESCNGAANVPGRIRHDFELAQNQQGQTESQTLKGLRIGVQAEYFADGLDGEVDAAIEAALCVFESLGAQRGDISLPGTRLAIPASYVIAPAEASRNPDRHDGVPYGK